MPRPALRGPGSSRWHSPQERLRFLSDQNVPEPVIRLIEGHGFMVRRARDVGLATADDASVREVCLAHQPPLTLITTDADFRDSALRGGVAVLFLRAPDVTARDRLQMHFDEAVRALLARHPLVTLAGDGVRLDPGRRRGGKRR
jgi:predicted nuclease of predicted toxin-antitoxin system